MSLTNVDTSWQSLMWRQTVAAVSNLENRMDTVDELLGPRELAAYLRVPLNTVYRWRSAGGGPRGSRVGRHVRYRRADVDAWLDSCSDQPEAS